MADDNTLNIILRFLVDEKSKAAAKKEIAGVGQGAGTSALRPAQDFKDTAQSVIQASKELNIPIEQAVKSMAGLATGGFKTEQQILADVKAFQEMEAASNQVAASVANIDKNVQHVGHNSKMMMVGMTGFVIGMTGMQLQKLGQGILSPIQDYTKYAGMASGASARWLQTQERLQEASLRIGAELSKTVLPTMEKISNAAMQVARWMEAHPELAKAAAMFAGGSIVVGGLLAIGGQVMSASAAMIQLLAMIKAGQAAGVVAGAAVTSAGAAAGAGAAGAGAAVGVGIAATIGAILPYILIPAVIGAVAVAAYKALAQTDFGKSRNMTNAPGQLATLAAYGAGGTELLGGSPERAAQWGMAIGKLTGSVDALGNASDKAANQLDNASEGLGASQAEVDAFISYQKAQTQAAKDYEEQRLQLVRDYGKARADSEAQYEKQRSDAVKQYTQSVSEDAANYARQNMQSARTFYDQERQREADYYKSRAKVARDYSIEVQRAEEDHQRQMLALQEEHNQRVADLSDQRDAMGLFREMRDYERTRQKAEQEYDIESARRNQDFARRIADMETQFSEERARRMQEYAQQRADAELEFNYRQQQRKAQLDAQLKALAEAHKAELEQLARDQQDKLNQLQRNYNNERVQRYQAFAEQLRDLNGQFARETNLRSQYYAYWTAQFQAFIQNQLAILQNAASPTGIPGKAAGGYIGAGLYRTGEEGYEYILNHDTTKMLEKLSAGRLNQNTIISLASGQQKQTVNYYDQKRIDGRVTAADKRWLKNMMHNTLMEAIGG